MVFHYKQLDATHFCLFREWIMHLLSENLKQDELFEIAHQTLMECSPNIIESKFKWDVLEKLNILTTTERRDLYSLEFLFNHLFTESQLTSVMKTIFSKREQVIHSMRHPNMLNVPWLNTVYAQTSFQYKVTQLWNNLPSEIQSCKKFCDFDVLVKRWLIMKRKDMYNYN